MLVVDWRIGYLLGVRYALFFLTCIDANKRIATLLALIVYQNMLFGEGLESILVQHNFSVRKFPIPKNGDNISAFFQHPDFILLEFNWPCSNLEQFIDNTQVIHENGTKIVMITNLINRYILRLIRKEKISGVVLKCNTADELIFALKQVADGRKYYSSLIENLIFTDQPEHEKTKVSSREKQILALLAQMKTTAEIAESLSISPTTVKTHRRNLLQKFKAKSLLNLLRLACRENLLNEETGYCSCCYKQFLGSIN